VSYKERETKVGPKKMLSIDGGGVRGLISLQILARIEAMLRDHRGNQALVLADEFDYIAGTSTGAIIAAGLALGKPVKDLDDLYQNLGPVLFEKRRLAGKFWSLYKDGPLRSALQDIFGHDTTFGDAQIQTLLLCVLQNTTTDSPWPLSNCTAAKYNGNDRPDNNLQIPLWQVVRASTAAPVFFPPEEVILGPRKFVFQDGGVTPYNNPAFIQYVMATAPEYKLGWADGVDHLLSVSIGTGSSASTRPSLKRSDVNIMNNATHLLDFLMNSASVEQDRLCRIFGDCRFGEPIDREVGAMVSRGDANARFSYVRYNADLSQESLNKAGLGNIKSEEVCKLDAVDALDDLRRIGLAASTSVDLEHFSGFL
jgi:uncharacterized protein